MLAPEAKDARDGPLLLAPDMGELEKGGERRKNGCAKLESAVESYTHAHV